MKKNPLVNGKTVRLLVLIPHPDTQRIARQYSGELFRAGWKGARLFPTVIPLAILDNPLPPSVIMAGAYNLAFIQSQEEGIPFFSPRQWGAITITPFFHIGGISFSIPPIEKWLSRGVYQQELSPLLGLTVFTQPWEDLQEEDVSPKFGFPLEDLRFRAAALANCVMCLSEIKSTHHTPGQKEPLVPCFRGPSSCGKERSVAKEGISYYSRWIIGKPCWLPKKPSRGTGSRVR